ncbi:MAG TPA: serine/threonine-protein kinase, partial [Labilithrix sp.]
MNELRQGFQVTPAVRLLRPIGQGGMGKVWVAEHAGLKTEVVVKFMAPPTDADSADMAARFDREAAIASSVKSPHVVQMFDHGVTSDDLRYIVMEKLEGHDLAEHLHQNGPMPLRDAAALVLQVAKALGRAHAQGVIHRDIKPENIFLCDQSDGELYVKVLDFGIAKSSQLVQSTSTVTGQVVGTPYYMSPEQIVGDHRLDSRTDVWSLGVVAFEALTGKRPFEGATVGAITLALHTTKPRMTAIKPDLPATLDDWFARVCSYNVEGRYDTAREAANALYEAIGEANPHGSAIMRPPMQSDPMIPIGVPSSGPERAVTSLSTSFHVPGTPRKPSVAMLAGAAAAVVALGVVAVLALKGSSGSGDKAPAATTPPAESAVAIATASASATASATATAAATETPTASATASA